MKKGVFIRVCSVCEVDETTNRIEKHWDNGVLYYTKHGGQIKKHKEITDSSKPKPMR